jgi:hypothetical protein
VNGPEGLRFIAGVTGQGPRGPIFSFERICSAGHALDAVMALLRASRAVHATVALAPDSRHSDNFASRQRIAQERASRPSQIAATGSNCSASVPRSCAGASGARSTGRRTSAALQAAKAGWREVTWPRSARRCSCSAASSVDRTTKLYGTWNVAAHMGHRSGLGQGSAVSSWHNEANR